MRRFNLTWTAVGSGKPVEEAGLPAYIDAHDEASARKLAIETLSASQKQRLICVAEAAMQSQEA